MQTYLQTQIQIYQDITFYINRMKKKEDIAMQTGNLREETTPNCRIMT